MNTRKNKRKSNSRLRRRRRPIKRTKKMKGGGPLLETIMKAYRCFNNPVATCASAVDTAANIPSSLQSLESSLSKGLQLLDYCRSINTSKIPIELSTTFNSCISELSQMIGFVNDNNILRDFRTLSVATPESSNDLLQKYSRIYTAVSSVQLSNVNSIANVIIWADWWRSKLEYMITDLTTVLTQIIGRFVGLTAAAAPPAAAAAANSMNLEVGKLSFKTQ
jgi:hypothetical protein